MKYAFAGDRQISCDILKKLIVEGFNPSALIVSSGKNETHANKLIAISGLDKDKILYGNEIKKSKGVNLLKSLSLDYILGIHFPYIIPTTILDIPKIGFLNLHPAYLPYNKGWHTPSWAIIDNTPYGATLHFMTEKLDEGAIVHQLKIEVEKTDTANSLYNKVLKLEKKVFFEALPNLVSLNPRKIKQVGKGTSHSKKDLSKIQEIDLNEYILTSKLLDKLRALRTNNPSELPFFMDRGKRIGIKIDFEIMD